MTLSRRIMISASREAVAQYLRELAHMASYEPRIQLVRVLESAGETARVEASGRFLLMPWRGEFEVRFAPDGGYRSVMAMGPLKLMESLYHLRPVAGGTVLTHEERYVFPVLLRPLAWLLRGSLKRALELEVGVIKEGAERLNRRLQLQQLEK